ncbi:hypothetical protein BGW38_009915 [Lunasporangiospora selenospora]|uniref:Uncharacterized protein n=1 Tax=Lunasporangiospora selenospora TaxID=979761 RepID=A0A9P6G2J1_9FUNG|nr:hypothetical protein BGW38_009915 [Lunasporangiospora selenospora]
MAVEAQDGRLDILDNRCRLQTSLIDQPTATKEPRPGSSHCTISWAQRPQRLYYANDRTVMAWNSVVNRNSEIFEASEWMNVGSRIDALAINTDDILLAVGQSTGRLEAVNRSSGNSIVLETPTKMVFMASPFATWITHRYA